eukprot:TRINITY_DN6017_c0_g1_i3.p1 TRINITY_DN6017_c0_g1~~TRINITY_DN6017_c0_g1_i3.p1  ORF type:complete len:244 (-),score=34.65 TRINITY_DN6017_c0_g1_i3:379-1110(-)
MSFSRCGCVGVGVCVCVCVCVYLYCLLYMHVLHVLTVDLQIEVLNNTWIEIPLLGRSKNTISSWNIQTTSDTLPVDSSTSNPSSTHSLSSTPRMAMTDIGFSLLSPRSAVYTVRVRISAPVSNPSGNKQQSSITVSLPSGLRSITNTLEYELVALPNAYVTVSPVFPVEREQKVSPGSSENTTATDSDEEKPIVSTVITALFPPTQELYIEWVAQDGEGKLSPVRAIVFCALCLVRVACVMHA